ncbi:hypothetical protein EYF80_031574 [Liparis tanakae]|uniref:Uncharacterized protein n=1 Tax=Liparis tanakae TaxID=230148 RepID=A0A4Z2H045_9TELE|nr:hypothetical protein EYF80_031574 [Liparis tanakae]
MAYEKEQMYSTSSVEKDGGDHAELKLPRLLLLTCSTLTRTMELVTCPYSSCCLAMKDRLMSVQATMPGRPLKKSLKSNHLPTRGLNSMPIM